MTHRSKRLCPLRRISPTTTIAPTPRSWQLLGVPLNIRFELNATTEYGRYTVSDVRPESPDNIVRMGPTGRKRLGTSGEFAAIIDSQVAHPTYNDATAKAKSEFVERQKEPATPAVTSSIP